MSTIKTGTTLTTAYQVVGDTTGALVIQTGSTPTTAVTVGSDQNATFAGTVTATNHIGPGTGLTGTASGLSIGGNAATATTATSPASGGTFITSSNIGSQSVSYATTAGSASNGGVTSVNSTTGAVTLANLSDFSRSLASSGYQKLPGGMIIQWGSTVANGTVTFPTAFPSACVNVNVQLLTSANNYALAYSPSTTSFSIVGNGSATIYWMAMGY